MPVFVADIHHVARVIIMILDAVLRDAGARQRIFGGEKGRREVIIALREEHQQSRILAQRLPAIGRDVQIAIAVAATAPPAPLTADTADQLLFAVGPEPKDRYIG